jgi:hypothetical protein
MCRITERSPEASENENGPECENAPSHYQTGLNFKNLNDLPKSLPNYAGFAEPAGGSSEARLSGPLGACGDGGASSGGVTGLAGATGAAGGGVSVAKLSGALDAA